MKQCAALISVQKKKKKKEHPRQYDDCPRRQVHPAATCKDGLPKHIFHREREREIKKKKKGCVSQ